MSICSGITYDAGDDRITVDFVLEDVKGDSFSDPYTFQDIYDTDVANGWGVFKKYGNVYISDASIWIEGSDTFVEDSNFVLSFQGDFIDSYILNISAENVKLDGCSLGGGFSSILDSKYFKISGNVDFNYVTFNEIRGIFIYKGTFNYCSIFDSIYAFMLYGGSVSNLFILSCTNGIRIIGYDFLENIQIYTAAYGFFLERSFTASGIQMGGNAYDFRFYMNSNEVFNLVNSIVDIDSFRILIYESCNQTLNLKSIFKVNISGGDGGIATLYDQFGNQVATQTLSGEWELADKVLYTKRYIETDGTGIVENTKTVYEPFTLTVEKPGYQTLEIPNIYATIDGIGTLSPTVVEGKMVLVEVTGENLQHFITEDKLTHEITEDKLTHEITD